MDPVRGAIDRPGDGSTPATMLALQRLCTCQERGGNRPAVSVEISGLWLASGLPDRDIGVKTAWRSW
jgi:hypothetical protein